ncbi:MAG: GTP-binding protein [Candidatus Heimdallarchaeota archaeon]|nr:GTP-binding protein [Candidatus Heimdallarchaeota archaeon]
MNLSGVPYPMDEKNSSNQHDEPNKEHPVEKRIDDDDRFDEMEEFALKVRVELEDALTGRDDYLHLLEDVYDLSDKMPKKYRDEFHRFRLLSAENTEEIHMISCFLSSGKPLFDYSVSEKVDPEKSHGLILNAIKNYVRYKLGELLEILTLETYSIHLFLAEKTYIISIITSKNLPRDKIAPLAIQMARTLKYYPNETPYTNKELKGDLDRAISATISTLVKEQHTLKIILIGDGAVGKTSIRRRYLGEGFKDDYQMTIGADLAAKAAPTIYAGGKQIKYLIWDLAGQPRFNHVRKAYYMSAVGALVVFDITRPESFQNIVTWMNELWRHNGRGPVPLVVLGNKTDLCEQGLTCVPEEKAFTFIRRLSDLSHKYKGFKIHFLPTSAKTGLNIDKAFELLGEAIMDFLGSSKNSRKQI